MTLDELKQIKDSLSQGVMIHKGKWLEVLDAAIEGKSASTETGGWISYDGGGCPVDGMSRVSVLRRDGFHTTPRKAKDWDWSIDGGGSDIIQYRVMP